MNKKTKIILLVTISILIVIGLFRQGVLPKYNYFTAKWDIITGDVRFISIGFPAFTSKEKEKEKVDGNYGFKVYNIGCSPSDAEFKAIESYNTVIEEYLKKRNGNNWRINHKKEVDSLYNLVKRQNE
jgi:hypothetical protein